LEDLFSLASFLITIKKKKNLRTANSIQNKILSLPGLQKRLAQWRVLNKTVAFTNGCFDILHAGHITALIEAATHADFLIVGLNSNSSTKKLKGEDRPVNDEEARALVLAALSMVDAIVVFSEDTPLQLIKAVMPDVLVKGGDYKLEEIVGAKEVVAAGGKVVINPILPGFSTTSIINKISK
jgi:D-beta-D-heptose 7-phosphate kinase/D-beta-D-heptose 1-phosphate adenosyltransferase